MKKRILSLFMAAIMVVSLLPMSAFAAGPTKPEDAEWLVNEGDNHVWWKVDNGTLTVGGEGAMQDYPNSNYQPWKDIRGSITSVIISSGVTHIGECAFQSFASLNNIRIPTSVESIANHAFRSCSSLTSVTIPASVTTIGNSVFRDCQLLESVTLEANTPPTLGTDVFKNCSAVKICVPAGSVEAYKVADGWSGFVGIIEAIPTYAISNGTPQSGAEKNHGYITIDKENAAEGDTVTVTVNPEDGYKLKSLTAVPEAKTISTIADVLATVEGGFPQGTGNMKEAPENAWVCGSDRYTFVVQSGQNSALSFYYSEYVNPSTGEVTGNATPVLTTTGVIAGENGYTATFNTITLTFNMTDGKLTGIAFSSTNGNMQNNYGGTYTAPTGTTPTPAEPETITPEKQTDGTYQFKMPDYAVTVKAEFEAAVIEMVCDSFAPATYAGEYYVTLTEKDSTVQVYFDFDTSVNPFQPEKTYTLDEMIADYVAMGDKNDWYVWHPIVSCTYIEHVGQDGNLTSIEANVTTDEGKSYHITYTVPTPEDITVTAVDYIYDSAYYDIYLTSTDTKYILELKEDLVYGKTYTYADMVPDWTCTLTDMGFADIKATDATLTVTKDDAGLIHVVATMTLNGSTHKITYDEPAFVPSGTEFTIDGTITTSQYNSYYGVYVYNATTTYNDKPCTLQLALDSENGIGTFGSDKVKLDYCMLYSDDFSVYVEFFKAASDFVATQDEFGNLSVTGSLYEANGDKYIFNLTTPHTHGEGDSTITFEKAITTFDELKDLFTNGGSGYLANDIECTVGLTVAANVDLCLNDKVLNLAGKGNINVTEGKTFKLYDCGTTVRYYDKDGSTGLWTLNVAKTSGDHTTKGGIVTGGTTNGNGAGILVYGTFTLDGGNIVGNKATMNAGGVLNDKGTFTMTGGTIVGNTAAGNGGGVYVNNGTFTMTGGEISGNMASNNGGGAYMTGSKAEFGMSGGTISGNTTTGNGGGVYSSGDTFSMTDGTISGNTAKTGGGVYSGSKFTMSGGEIKDNTATSGGGVYSSGKFSMTDGTISGNTTTGNGGGAYMTGSQAEFGMSGGTISGNTASNGGGVYVNGCKFLMSGGTISGNTASNGGGAYMTGSKAEFGMSGGTISGNTATAKGGGVYSGSKFMMSGGTIFDNKAGTGGGVYFYGSNTFTMSGGTISGNTTTGNGGGVYMSGTIILGGTAKITDNTAGAEGSKVTNNLYLPTGKTVTFGTGNGEGGNGVAAPATGFAVGVTTETAPANGTPVQITTNGATTDTSYFTPDNDAYEVKFNANHLELAVKHTHAPVLVNGQAATETAAGFKDYYKCDCGDFFEDATGNVPIEDLATWQAQGGNGYIPSGKEIKAARETATEAIVNALPEYATDEAKAIAEQAAKDIEAAETVGEVEEIKSAAINEIQAVMADVCPHCGKVHKNIFYTIHCYLIRIFRWIVSNVKMFIAKIKG